jgi:hypothetical protein
VGKSPPLLENQDGGVRVGNGNPPSHVSSKGEVVYVARLSQSAQKEKFPKILY